MLSFIFLKPDLDHSLELGLGEKHSVYDELINYQKSIAFESGALCLKASTRTRRMADPHACLDRQKHLRDYISLWPPSNGLRMIVYPWQFDLCDLFFPRPFSMWIFKSSTPLLNQPQGFVIFKKMCMIFSFLFYPLHIVWNLVSNL